MKEKLKNFFFKPKSLGDAFKWFLTTVVIIFSIVLLLVTIFNLKDVIIAVLFYIVMALILATIAYIITLLLQIIANTVINTYNYLTKKKLKK